MKKYIMMLSVTAIIYYSAIAYAQTACDAAVDAANINSVNSVSSIEAPPLQIPALVIPPLYIPSLAQTNDLRGSDVRRRGRDRNFNGVGGNFDGFRGNGNGRRFFNGNSITINRNPGISTRPSSPYFDYSRTPGVVRITG